MKLFFAGALLIAAFGTARAEPPKEVEPISTDRPDFVESSLTVGKGRFQIETSTAFERIRDSAGRVKTQSAPTLFRMGVSNNVELRMETDSYLRVTGAVPTQSGTADIAIGAKWHTRDGGGSRPSVGWLLHADLPSGKSAFRGKGVRPSLRSVMEWELPKDVSLGVMPGLAWENDETQGRYLSGIMAVVVGKSWTSKFRTFAEVSGQALRAGRFGGNVVTYDAGAAWLLGNDLQLDVVGMWGATKNYRGATLGLGISRRY